jgi:hypothetical protein
LSSYQRVLLAKFSFFCDVSRVELGFEGLSLVASYLGYAVRC